MIVKIAVLAAVAVVAVVRGGAAEYPCSAGYHQVNVPITATIGACADTSTRRGCVQVTGQTVPRVQTFAMSSCERDGGR